MSSKKVRELRSNWYRSHAQGKGKKRSVGWFPASYVKLLESRKEEDAGATAGSGEAVATGAVTMLKWSVLDLLPCVCFTMSLSCALSLDQIVFGLTAYQRWGALCGPLPLHWTVWRRTVLWGNLKDQLWLCDVDTKVDNWIMISEETNLSQEERFLKNTRKKQWIASPLERVENSLGSYFTF